MNLLALALLPLTAHAAETSASGNSSCPYVTENIRQVVGGQFFEGWPNGESMWKSNGQLNLLSRGVSGRSDKPRSQKAKVEGGGLRFGPGAKEPVKTHLALDYDTKGRLTALKLEDAALFGKRKVELAYKWEGDSCLLDKVTNVSADLNGKTGISFDRALCDRLAGGGLLNEQLSNSCTDFNKKLGEAIDNYSAKLPNGQTFALWTSAPDGSTSLKPYDKKASSMANISIAQDCMFHMKPNAGQKATNDAADSGVERGSPGESTPAH